MRLTRHAVIRLSDPRPSPGSIPRHYLSSTGTSVTVEELLGSPHEPKPADLGDVVVRLANGRPLLARVAASVGGAPLAIDDQHRPVVPENYRLIAEASIEEFADVLGVAHQCRRSVESLPMCVTLDAEGDEDLTGVFETSPQGSPAPTRARVLHPDDVTQAIGLLADRVEGARLLAASQSDHSPVGRAREIFRLFEAGFGKPLNSLATPLHEFLHTTPHDTMNFRKREIQSWIEKRGPIMHADRNVYWTGDVIPILPRIEWAAYDVLLNKRTWGTRDFIRRDSLGFNTGVSTDGTVLRFHGESGVTEMLIPHFDQYGAFPMCPEVQRVNIPTTAISDLTHASSYSATLSRLGEASP